VRLTHVAWDYGAVDRAMHEVLGDSADVAKPKTTLTLCGRRVSINLIDNGNPICQDCIKEKRKAEIVERKLTQWIG